METKLSIQDLRDFELKIFQLFKDKKIASPVHLRGGNEQQLIEMRFISDLSYTEISDITGKNSGALRVSMSRTLNKLKQVFTDMGISESNI